MRVAWPECLLKFNSALNDPCACDVLEVLVGDPDVKDNIIMIVDRSEATLIDQQKEGEIFRLCIQKGK